jgi:beta-mannanase
LDDWIKGLKEFHDPVFIRLSHEMDGDWYPYSEGYKKDPKRNTAGDYIAYWRYVVDRFRKAGVTNVAWVWCVNADRSGGKDWPDYYPGDEYVDWLAIDLYSSRNPRPIIQQFLELGLAPDQLNDGGTAA